MSPKAQQIAYVLTVLALGAALLVAIFNDRKP